MSRGICVVTSADNEFAVGLAGTVKSALTCLSPEKTMRLLVLDGGIAAQNKQALLRHWSDPRLSVDWIAVDRRKVSEFVISDHISDATYYRLLAPELLPSEVTRFIFLDADLLVRRDLSALWDEPMNGLPCLAVQDIGAPYVDSRMARTQQSSERGALVVECPIPNYKALGLSPSSPYFNAGVMVVNLDLWRKDQLARKMLDVLRTQGEHVLFWDQYALNVVLSGRWRQISPLWNQNAIVYRYPGWTESPFCTRDYPTYVSDPWIAHFNWRKPWQQDCTHPFADEFLRHLAGSPWEISFDRQVPIFEVPVRNEKRPRGRELSRRLRRSFRMGVRTLLRQRAA